MKTKNRNNFINEEAQRIAAHFWDYADKNKMKKEKELFAKIKCLSIGCWFSDEEILSISEGISLLNQEKTPVQILSKWIALAQKLR